jgi:HEAT repeat protein
MDNARRRVAFLFAFPIGQGDEERIVATRLRSLWAPIDLGNAPLMWLGEAEDAESVALLERIFARVRSPDVRTEFGPMVAIHADTRVALPVLRRIVRGDLAEEVRAEAIAWIGYQLPDPEVTDVVAEVLEREPSHAILDEALGALVPAEIIRRGLLDRLVDLLRDHPDPQARALVAEALEPYDDPLAVAALEAAARHDPAAVVRLEAVDALADSGKRGAEQALARIAIDAGDPDVRREAADHLEDDSR